MNQIKPKIGLASNKNVKENYLTKDNLNRINKKFDFRWGQFDEESSWDEPPNTNQKVKKKFANFCKDLDGLIVCHGSPLVDEEVLKVAKNLKFIGELEGDRFSQRIDLEASFKKNINVVDTTHGSSYPVAEWALALSIVGLKNGGYHFRKMINVVVIMVSGLVALIGYDYIPYKAYVIVSALTGLFTAFILTKIKKNYE